MLWKQFTPHQSCPAKDATCFRCNRKGHYSTQCLSKTVAEITDPLQEQTLNDSSGSDFYSDILYLDTVNGHNEKHLCVEVLIENDPATFKVDTGAEVTALSDSTFHLLKHPDLQLEKSN